MLGVTIALAAGLGAGPELGLEYLDSRTIGPDWTRGAHAAWPATELSGIESLPYGWYMVVSDDRGRDAPPRYGFLRIEYIADRKTGEPRFRGIGRVALEAFLTTEGENFPENVLDPESVRLLGEENSSRQFLVASEGYAKDGLGPRLYLFDQIGGGEPLDLTPPEFEPTGDTGIRHNRGFESLGLTPDRAWAYTANEEPLVQDEASGCVRILEVDVGAREVTRSFAYELGPATLCEDPEQMGLVELIALERGRLLALERDEDPEHGFDGRLYLVELGAGEDVSGRGALSGAPRTAAKTLLGTLSDLGVPPANYEGFCLGPAIPGGRVLILVSDGEADEANAARFVMLRLSGDLDRAAEPEASGEGEG